MPPLLLISEIVCIENASFMSNKTISHFFYRANSRAIYRPIPLAPPTTKTFVFDEISYFRDLNLHIRMSTILYKSNIRIASIIPSIKKIIILLKRNEIALIIIISENNFLYQFIIFLQINNI